MSAELDGAAPKLGILVVDDEPDNRELLELILSWEGFAITQAASGAEALAAVLLKLPDLILLDVMMPGMNGYEVVSRIKASAVSRHVPVMMVSALQGPEARALGLAAGADDYLSKPFNRAELVIRVRSLLGATASAATAAEDVN